MHRLKIIFISLLFTVPTATKADGLVQADFLAISNAMEQFYLNTVFEGLPGYFTTVENLDDSMTGTVAQPYNAINDSGGAWVFRPEDPTNIFRRTLTAAQWGGPYISSYNNGGRQLEDATGDYDEGGPFDIFGYSPIYLFTPIGLLEPRTGDVSLRYYGDEFDHYTLVSFGPDGEFGGDDDIIRTIPGFTVNVPVVSSGRLTSNKSSDGDYLLSVRGYNLGSDPGEVLIDGVTVTNDITAWTPSLVTVTLDDFPPSDAQVTVRLSGGVLLTRSAPIIFETEETKVPSWFLY